MIKQLAHCCLYSKNIQEMIDFYTEILGLRIQFVMKDSQGTDFGYYIAAGNLTFLEIFDAEKACREWGDTTEGMEAPGKIRHFCFEVTSVEQTVQEIRQKGIEVHNIKEGLDGSRQCWVVDPDGNWIELMEYTAGSRQVTG